MRKEEVARGPGPGPEPGPGREEEIGIHVTEQIDVGEKLKAVVR
jgi:hypothetical protein